MVNQMKTIRTELIQMIRVWMSASLSRTNVAKFSLETPREDLGLDSLDKLSLLFEIEDHFNVTISDTTAAQMKCDADIPAYFSSIDRSDPAVCIGSADGCVGALT